MDDDWKAALQNWVSRMSAEERDALWRIVLRYKVAHMSGSERELLSEYIKEWRENNEKD